MKTLDRSHTDTINDTAETEVIGAFADRLTPTQKQWCLKIGGGVLAAAAFLGLYNLAEDPATQRAQQEETEQVDKINQEGGRFYQGQLALREDANVRSEPLINNGDPADGTSDNKVDHPSRLILEQPIIVSNEDGTWFGFPKESDVSVRVTEEYLWVNEEAIDTEKTPIDSSMYVSFDENDYPRSGAHKLVQW